MDLLATGPWHRFFDALERMPRFLPEGVETHYYSNMNALFAEERIGYRFESGNPQFEWELKNFMPLWAKQEMF